MENIRGCAGTIEYAASKMAYAHTIKLAAEDKSRFIVAGASPEIVEVRFANIDEKGNYSSHAEPVGRANLETALRTGVEDI